MLPGAIPIQVQQPDSPALRPIFDEDEVSARTPLAQVLETQFRTARYPVGAFHDVLNSRLRHRQFQDLETYVSEVRRTKVRVRGGRWQLEEFYAAVNKPAAGEDADDGQWETHFGLLDEWRQAFPESVTARVAYASTMKNYAWKARTGEFAPKVTPAQWQLFSERLNAAEKTLVEASQLQEKCPGWFATMGMVALGQGWERQEFMRLINEAVEFEPGYGSYYHILSSYLLPRWHGLDDDEWSHALASVTDRQGTDEAHATFHMVFVDQFQAAYEYDEDSPKIRKYWSWIKQGYHARDKLYKVENWTMNDYARMAYIAGDREEARQVLDTLGRQPNLGYWEDDPKLFEKALTWANQK
jgi:hypothetical protein